MAAINIQDNDRNGNVNLKQNGILFNEASSIHSKETESLKPPNFPSFVVDAIKRYVHQDANIYPWSMRELLLEEKICDDKNVPSISSINRILRYYKIKNPSDRKNNQNIDTSNGSFTSANKFNGISSIEEQHKYDSLQNKIVIEGNTFIAASQRPDGSWRKQRKVKPGFFPQEEVPLYESKGKRIARESKIVEGLPVGLTKEDWEKMKTEQEKLLNPQIKTTKKKNNKKKNTEKSLSTENDNTNLANQEPTVVEDSSNSNAIKKKKNKNKNTGNSNKETNSPTHNNSTANSSSTNEDDWVTMGKPKKQTTAATEKITSTLKNLTLNNKTNKQVKKKTDTQNKQIIDLASDMIIDNHNDDENEEEIAKKHNTEKQLLVKKIKTLKRKLKDVETLKELQKQQSLDKEQIEKLNKSAQFAKDLVKLQAKLDQMNKK